MTPLSALTLHSQFWEASFHLAPGAPSAQACSRPLPGRPAPAPLGSLAVSSPAPSAPVHHPSAATALSLCQRPPPHPQCPQNHMESPRPPRLTAALFPRPPARRAGSHQSRRQAPGPRPQAPPSLWRPGLAAGGRKHVLLEVREGFQEEVTFKPEGLVGWGWVGRHLSRRVGMGKVGMRQEGWVQGPLAGGGSQSEQPLGTQARALPTLKTFRRAWKPRNGRREVGRIEGYSTDSLPEGGIQNT